MLTARDEPSARAWARDELFWPAFRAAGLAWPAERWQHGRGTGAARLKGCPGLVGDTPAFCCDAVADGGMCSGSTENGAAARRCSWHAWRLLLRLKPACAHELWDGSDSLCHVLARMWTVYHVLNVTALRVYASVSERGNTFKYLFSRPESNAVRLGRRSGRADVRRRPFWFTRVRALVNGNIDCKNDLERRDVVNT